MEVVNTIGRRKSAVARVYLKEGNGQITINGKDQKEYFTLEQWLFKLNQPFALTDQEGKFDVTVNVKGGGFTGQVEAIRLGISRALVQLDEESKPALKKEGLMTRDPRMVERKKPGQKKARKKFQFSKR
ncbi:MAG: 30S ribosomal protein S9 [Flavobacteriales bacterium]|nr:30S ribosomal protein S9 [Flavobacteriales bacterium]MBO73212.1 30S ribosomal protein S9 [Flavobacteriales bacterium]|tara:strand:+ start:1669 stop:2055 length:387 start_codon:yes stop_codon:yes gene_type:complete